MLDNFPLIPLERTNEVGKTLNVSFRIIHMSAPVGF